MVIDLPAHRARLADDGIGEVGAVRGGGVGDDGERGLERMGEVAGVAPRLLGLPLIMGEQLVQLLRHRLELLGESFLDPGFLARSGARRVGKESIRTYKTRWAPDQVIKNTVIVKNVEI